MIVVVGQGVVAVVVVVVVVMVGPERGGDDGVGGGCGKENWQLAVDGTGMIAETVVIVADNEW